MTKTIKEHYITINADDVRYTKFNTYLEASERAKYMAEQHPNQTFLVMGCKCAFTTDKPNVKEVTVEKEANPVKATVGVTK